MIAHALLSYAMTVFLLPTELRQELDVTMTKFWWTAFHNTRKSINWMSWDRMCIPKSNGWMRFKRLGELNLAMLGKQSWRLITLLDSLVSKIFKT